MHTLHFTFYIPYLTLLCLAPFQSVRILPVLFLCFDPRPQCMSRTDHTLHNTLYTLPPPTFTLQTPVLNLTPIFSSYSSSSIAFLLFWPPQCTSMHGPGGNRTPPSPNCHLVHWPKNRPRWPPQMVGELPQMVWFRHAAPQTPYSHFVRNEQLQPSLTAGFRNYLILSYIILYYLILSYIILYYLILSYIILYYLILSYIILYYLILSYIILYYPILSYIILYYIILSYIILYYLILSYIILYYLILSDSYPQSPRVKWNAPWRCTNIRITLRVSRFPASSPRAAFLASSSSSGVMTSLKILKAAAVIGIPALSRTIASAQGSLPVPML